MVYFEFYLDFDNNLNSIKFLNVLFSFLNFKSFSYVVVLLKLNYKLNQFSNISIQMFELEQLKGIYRTPFSTKNGKLFWLIIYTNTAFWGTSNVNF